MWDERMNSAIDEVAQQMTEGSPAAGADFRRRILARIEAGDAPRRSWRAAFGLSPIAVAAVIVIAVFVFRGSERVTERSAQNATAAKHETARDTVRLPPSPPDGFGGATKPDPTDHATPQQTTQAAT